MREYAALDYTGHEHTGKAEPGKESRSEGCADPRFKRSVPTE